MMSAPRRDSTVRRPRSMPETSMVPPNMTIVMSAENSMRVPVRTGYPRRFIHGSRASEYMLFLLLKP